MFEMPSRENISAGDEVPYQPQERVPLILIRMENIPQGVKNWSVILRLRKVIVAILMDNFRLNSNPLAAKSQTRRMEKVKRKSHKCDHKTQKQTWRRQKEKIGLFLTYSFHENITRRQKCGSSTLI